MPLSLDISTRIEEFRNDLVRRPNSVIVQKYITHGKCYALDEAAYFELKSSIASEFALHPSQVLIVGSAKLGFSIVKAKRYRPFGDTSDIDVAIISPALFNSMWEDAFNFWRTGAYWPEIDAFRRYLFRGWIRPDKLPPEKSFERRRHWWEYFRTITQSQVFGPFPIRAGLYKSWHYLESYQQTCVSECRGELDGIP